MIKLLENYFQSFNIAYNCGLFSGCLTTVHCSVRRYCFCFIATININIEIVFEYVREKTNNLGSDQDRHKPGCTVKEDGKRLEILDLERRGIVQSV